MKKWKLERAKGDLKSSSEKRDEARAISVLAGMLLGSVLGMPISIALGLLGPPGTGLPSDFSQYLIFLSTLFSFSIVLGCLITFAICSYLWKREGKTNLAHCALSSCTLFSLWIYLLLLFTFLFNPFSNFLLQYFTSFSVFWYVALAFFPFMVIIAYIQYPSLRPRIRHQLGLLATRAFWSEIRRNPKKHGKMLFLTTALVIIIIVDILSAVFL
jgi:hypothetical protein